MKDAKTLSERIIRKFISFFLLLLMAALNLAVAQLRGALALQQPEI